MPAERYYLPPRKLVSQEDAAITEQPHVPRSKFHNTWNRLMTFDAGRLVPFLVDEVLPGDHITYNITAFARMQTALFPIFSNQRIDTFIFFVPARILWTNWVRFMGEQPDPASSINFLIPTITSDVGGMAINTIYDHMGIPCVGQIAAGQQITFNALPFRAYNKIYDTWFRDQNLVGAVPINLGDGPDNANDYTLRNRAKSHDYFTSALPFPQKFTAPLIPLSGKVRVSGLGVPAGTAGVADGRNILVTGLTTQNFPASWDEVTAPTHVMKATGVGAGVYPDVWAELGEATGISVNTFRQAFLTQQWLERQARGGTRYTEIVKSHFGVNSPDARLQRPEYIGGGQTPIAMTPIAQTATGGAGVGALTATGAAAGQHRASYAATEHGYIIGLINIRTEIAYQQGLHKLWTRSARTDLYWPSLAELGEQAILRQELYCTGVDGDDTTVFGYQERYHEYRQRTSEVTGMFNSTHAGTIDTWHLAQNFTAPPLLNQTFIEDTPPVSRVLAAGGSAADMQYLADIMIQRVAVRPIPTFGTPATLGRF